MDIQAQIVAKLQQDFEPTHLDVINESHMHRVPPHSQTHFKVTLVTPVFAGLSRIQRHRSVNKVLAAELDTHIHALGLHLYTPEEWEKVDASPKSPPCANKISPS